MLPDSMLSDRCEHVHAFSRSRAHFRFFPLDTLCARMVAFVTGPWYGDYGAHWQ